MNNYNKNVLLTRQQAADYLGLTEGTLATWASTQRYGLPMVKMGRLVKYKISDLDQFIENRTTDFKIN